MVDIADVIGLMINKRLELMEPSNPQAVIKRLSAIGLDEGFLRRRITHDLDLGGGDHESIGVMADRIGAIFDWSPRDVLGSGALEPSPSVVSREGIPRGVRV